MKANDLTQTLALIADFFDRRKYGAEGVEGYRKSTDLLKFTRCLRELQQLGLIHSDRTAFADLGCADGRVNVLMSYFVRQSIGIEIDPDILGEFAPRAEELNRRLSDAALDALPNNIALFPGSSLDAETFNRIEAETGVRFTDIDLFYTYITLHDVFAEEIAGKARDGALYLVYGFNHVLPRYDHLELILPDIAAQGIAALYKKTVKR